MQSCGQRKAGFYLVSLFSGDCPASPQVPPARLVCQLLVQQRAGNGPGHEAGLMIYCNCASARTGLDTGRPTRPPSWLKAGPRASLQAPARHHGGATLFFAQPQNSTLGCLSYWLFIVAVAARPCKRVAVRSLAADVGSSEMEVRDRDWLAPKLGVPRPKTLKLRVPSVLCR